MKKSIIFILLLIAGMQMAWAQAGMLVWKDGKYAKFSIYQMDSVQFVSNVKEYDVNVCEYVDLELPSGTLWATCNVGAPPLME